MTFETFDNDYLSTDFKIMQGELLWLYLISTKVASL